MSEKQYRIIKSRRDVILMVAQMTDAQLREFAEEVLQYLVRLGVKMRIVDVVTE